MALKVGDNFSYRGQKPNFERDTFATLAAMKSFPTTSIDEGHISLCLEDGKRYKYSASFSVDPTLGKWRRVIDSVLDASSENPVQNKVILSKFREDEAAFAQQLAALAQSTATNLEGTRQALLEEDARNRREIEALIQAGSTAASEALANLRKDVEDDEAVTAASLNDKVGQSRTINGHDLSEDVILSKADVGLSEVDNTSDADKPVSTLTQLALDKKVDKQTGYSLISNTALAKLNNLPSQSELSGELQTLSGNLSSHVDNKENPHEVTKDQVGLGNVDNTSDADKPVSTATQTALDEKVSKTTKINGHALDTDITILKGDIGLGNVDNTSDADKPVSTAQQEAINELGRNTSAALNDLKTAVESVETSLNDSSEASASAINELAGVLKNLTINGKPMDGTNFTITKEDVGLGNVENESTSSMPVSTATQEALNAKVDKTTSINGHLLSTDVTITKEDVGLGNVDNTSDLNKPISTATQEALDGKVETSTTVNGHALSGNVEVTKTDLGLQDLESVVLQGRVAAALTEINADVQSLTTTVTTNEGVVAAALNELILPHDVLKFWIGTETQYANLEGYSDNTLYIITEDVEPTPTPASDSEETIDPEG
jgi:hypothetical protein